MPVDPVALHQTLVDHFDLEELRTLCFYLHVDYDILPGEGKAGKARELISYMHRHDRLGELVAAIASQRPELMFASKPPSPSDVPGTVVSTPSLPMPPEVDTKDLSPFVAGPPITAPRQFFGRKRELKRLFNLLRHSPLQNAAIIGPKRSGKTSLLLYLKSITTTPSSQLRLEQRADWLPEPERYHWVYVDFQDPRMGSREGLLRHLLACLGLSMPTPCDLDHFLDIIYRNLHNPIIILLDEIGVALQRYPELDNSFWEGLRSLAACPTGGNLAFILAAHESPNQLASHSNIGSPFFNIFGYTTTLGPLTEPEARELIASSPIPFPAADVEWILVQSSRWPILLQILCRERLIALEDNESTDVWKDETLRQMSPFRHLLEENQ
jgi:Effector-associated domain 7